MADAYSERLFSYGTLRDEVVQLANFGRKLVSSPDAVTGYKLSTVKITDSEVVAESGMEVHKILVPSDDSKETVGAWCLPSRRMNCAQQMHTRRMRTSVCA